MVWQPFQVYNGDFYTPMTVFLVNKSLGIVTAFSVIGLNDDDKTMSLSMETTTALCHGCAMETFSMYRSIMFPLKIMGGPRLYKIHKTNFRHWSDVSLKIGNDHIFHAKESLTLIFWKLPNLQNNLRFLIRFCVCMYVYIYIYVWLYMTFKLLNLFHWLKCPVQICCSRSQVTCMTWCVSPRAGVGASLSIYCGSWSRQHLPTRGQATNRTRYGAASIWCYLDLFCCQIKIIWHVLRQHSYYHMHTILMVLIIYIYLYMELKGQEYLLWLTFPQWDGLPCCLGRRQVGRRIKWMAVVRKRDMWPISSWKTLQRCHLSVMISQITGNLAVCSTVC